MRKLLDLMWRKSFGRLATALLVSLVIAIITSLACVGCSINRGDPVSTAVVSSNAEFNFARLTRDYERCHAALFFAGVSVNRTAILMPTSVDALLQDKGNLKVLVRRAQRDRSDIVRQLALGCIVLMEATDLNKQDVRIDPESGVEYALYLAK